MAWPWRSPGSGAEQGSGGSPAPVRLGSVSASPRGRRAPEALGQRSPSPWQARRGQERLGSCGSCGLGVHTGGSVTQRLHGVVVAFFPPLCLAKGQQPASVFVHRGTAAGSFQPRHPRVPRPVAWLVAGPWAYPPARAGGHRGFFFGQFSQESDILSSMQLTIFVMWHL